MKDMLKRPRIMSLHRIYIIDWVSQSINNQTKTTTKKKGRMNSPNTKTSSVRSSQFARQNNNAIKLS